MEIHCLGRLLHSSSKKVMTSSTSSDALARSTIDSGSSSSAEHLGNTFRKCNILAGFTPAFLDS